MRRHEVFTVDSPYAKLTITKERVTMKIPKTTTLVDAERLVKLYNIVAKKHPSPELTIRSTRKTVEELFTDGIEVGTGGGKNTTKRKILATYFEE